MSGEQVPQLRGVEPVMVEQARNRLAALAQSRHGHRYEGVLVVNIWERSSGLGRAHGVRYMYGVRRRDTALSWMCLSRLAPRHA